MRRVAPAVQPASRLFRMGRAGVQTALLPSLVAAAEPPLCQWRARPRLVSRRAAPVAQAGNRLELARQLRLLREPRLRQQQRLRTGLLQLARVVRMVLALALATRTPRSLRSRASGSLARGTAPPKPSTFVPRRRY